LGSNLVQSLKSKNIVLPASKNFNSKIE